MSIAIVWIRRDFRFDDNPALYFACERHEQVVVSYIHNPGAEAPWAPGEASNWWLHHTIIEFSKAINRYGNKLILRCGDSLELLLELCKETGAQSVYWNRLYEPQIVHRDRKIKAALGENGIEAKSFNGALIKEPWQVSKDDGYFYRVYTPFSRRYFQADLGISCNPEPQNIPPPSVVPKGEHVEQLSLLSSVRWCQGLERYWQPGYIQAKNRFADFIDQSIYGYPTARDIPSEEGVSRLSPHLHFGEISPRMMWEAIQAIGSFGGNEELVNPYLKQLVWRDFAHHLLFHLPHTPDQPFREAFTAFPWKQDDSLFAAWKKGKTGIPLIDAGMRELWQTGWMHNRVRMLVASFLTKNGLIHWRDGAKWFWDTLLDASLANNTMGWQWTAGCGVDAAPYFRIFNPVRQGERFDPKGDYVRRWVPEIAALPDKYIHQPWKTPNTILKTANIALGTHYPWPVLDLSKTRSIALSEYKGLSRNG